MITKIFKVSANFFLTVCPCLFCLPSVKSVLTHFLYVGTAMCILEENLLPPLCWVVVMLYLFVILVEPVFSVWAISVIPGFVHSLITLIFTWPSITLILALFAHLYTCCLLSSYHSADFTKTKVKGTIYEITLSVISWCPAYSIDLEENYFDISLN